MLDLIGRLLINKAKPYFFTAKYTFTLFMEGLIEEESLEVLLTHAKASTDNYPFPPCQKQNKRTKVKECEETWKTQTQQPARGLD